MSYDFTKGKYRAFIRTTYLNESGVSQTVDGEPETFDSEAVSYFTFKTNSDIKLDPETLEVPNAEETSSGTYKGLEYSFYDNGLAVISGTQSSSISGTDVTPWRENYDIEYIYAKATFCSGNVFRLNTDRECKELQFGTCGFASGTSDATTLFFGHWDYINFQNINWGNLTSYTNILNTYAKAADGFNEFKDYIFNQTQITDLANIFTALRLSEQIETFNVDIPLRITAATYMFSSFGGPGITINLRMESFINNSLYSFDAGNLNLYIENPIPSGSYLVNYSDVYEVYADIEMDSAATSVPIMNNNENMQYFNFGNRFDTSSISSFAYMFRNNPALIDVSRRQGDEHYGYQYSNPFDFTAAKNFRQMFQGDSALASIGRNATSAFRIDTNTQYMYYDSMLMGCSSFHKPVSITERTGYIMSMDSAFEESGITSFQLWQYGTAGTYSLIMSDSFRYTCRNAKNLEYASVWFYNAFGVGNVKYNQMFYGCTALMEVSIWGKYQYSSSVGYLYSSLDDVTEMFKNCTALENLAIYECDVGNDSSGGSTTDMLSGCSALKTVALSENAVVPSSKAIVLPKTMYLNGTAVTSISKGRGSAAEYKDTAA